MSGQHKTSNNLKKKMNQRIKSPPSIKKLLIRKCFLILFVILFSVINITLRKPWFSTQITDPISTEDNEQQFPQQYQETLDHPQDTQEKIEVSSSLESEVLLPIKRTIPYLNNNLKQDNLSSLPLTFKKRIESLANNYRPEQKHDSNIIIQNNHHADGQPTGISFSQDWKQSSKLSLLSSPEYLVRIRVKRTSQEKTKRPTEKSSSKA